VSSHHFVKEGQEPALLILDALPFQLAGPLLEWAPLVVVAEQALPDVLNWRIKIDVVVVREERVDAVRQQLLEQNPVRIIVYSQSPFQRALEFLAGEKQTAVNVMVRARDEDFRKAEQFMDQLQINLFDAELRWAALFSGHFEKWMPVFSTLHIRKTAIAQQIQPFSLKAVHEATYESADNGMVGLQSDQPFWVGEPNL